MKKIHFLLMLLFLAECPFTSLSQNIVYNYKPPVVMEGSNLIIMSSPSFSGRNKESYLNIDLNLNFIKWRFTNKYDYSVSCSPRFSFHQYREHIFNDTTITIKTADVYLRAATDIYLYKTFLYAGLFTNNTFSFANGQEPFTNNILSPFIGTGRITDAKMVRAVENFEEILFEENIIKEKLSPSVRKKLTELFDKRENREFISKYKDDNEIEFFVKTENILKEYGIINGSLSTRAVLKLYRAVNDYRFLYFPFFKGYQLQLSANFSNSKTCRGASCKYALNKDISFNGIVGLPFNDKTEIISIVQASFPVDNRAYLYPIAGGFYNPLTIKEEQTLHNSFGNAIINNEFYYDTQENDYSYIAGIKIEFFRYITNMIAFTEHTEYIFGKGRNGSENAFTFEAEAGLTYSILNSLNFGVNISYRNDNNIISRYGISTGFQYYIF